MFDSAPNNLPLEPTPKPSVQALNGINQTGMQEPEDIFADIKDPDLQASVSEVPQVPQTINAGGFPWKVLVTIMVPVAVIGLGVGGWFYYSSTKADVKTVQVPTQKVNQGTVPVSAVPDQTQPLDNPVPKPDETKLAASQAALSMMQAQAAQGNPYEMILEATTTSSISTTTGSDASGPEKTPVEVPANIPLPIQETDVQLQLGLDSDQDGLSNSEELLFGTDPMQSDTDGDGFSDKSEVANGYDPALKSAKLSDSTNLKHESFGALNIIIPEAWNKKAANGGTIDFLTGTPAVINLSMQTFASDRSLLEWVISETRGPNPEDLMPDRTASGFDVIYSKDRLTAWLLVGNTVYTFRYQPNGALTLDFVTIFDSLMLRQAKTTNN